MFRSAAISRWGAAALTGFLLLPHAALGRVRPHFGGELRIETSGAEAPDFVKLLVTETLTSIDTRGEIRPGLAVSWQSRNGDRQWQFRIREGVQLHGADSDAPFSATLAAETIRQGLTKAGIAGRVHAIGEDVIVEFDAPLPQFAALLADVNFGVAASDSRGIPMGSGPYTIQSIAAPRMTLVANLDYWGARRFPETITVLWGRTAREQALDLAAKRADLVEVPPEELHHAQQERTRLSNSETAEVVVLCAERAGAADAKLRQALSETIDRSALLNFIFQKQGAIAGTLLPNWMTGYGALLPVVHDTAHARQLRGEAGGHVAFTLGFDGRDAAMQLLAERLVLNAREVGLTLQTVARTSDVDWLLRRVPVRTANPAAALTEITHALHYTVELKDTSLESVLLAERAAVADYTLIPLLHLNHAWSASERLHDWSSATPLQPLPPATWIENKVESKP
jgi:ABC-type transport system substrate-binding protein